MDAVDSVLNATLLPLGTFAPIGATERQQAMLVIMGAAALVSLISTVVYKMFVDPEEMRGYKTTLEKLQKDLQKHQKDNEPKKVSEVFSKITETQMEMMNTSMKPTFFSMLPIITIFMWLRAYAGGLQLETLVYVPFPFIYDKLGWLGWYIMSSMAVSFPLRKLMGVEH